MKPDTIRQACAALADADAASYRRAGYIAISNAIQSLAQLIRQAPLTCIEISSIPPEGSLIHLLRWDATPEGKMQARPDGRFVMLDALEISLRDLDAVKPPRPTFPVLGSNGARIDLELVIDHGGQAKANHYQTVDRLAIRGGLSWCELHAVLHNRAFQKMDTNTAMIECRALEARYLSALEEVKP